MRRGRGISRNCKISGDWGGVGVWGCGAGWGHYSKQWLFSEAIMHAHLIRVSPVLLCPAWWNGPISPPAFFLPALHKSSSGKLTERPYPPCQQPGGGGSIRPGSLPARYPACAIYSSSLYFSGRRSPRIRRNVDVFFTCSPFIRLAVFCRSEERHPASGQTYNLGVANPDP